MAIICKHRVPPVHVHTLRRSHSLRPSPPFSPLSRFKKNDKARIEVCPRARRSFQTHEGSPPLWCISVDSGGEKLLAFPGSLWGRSGTHADPSLGGVCRTEYRRLLFSYVGRRKTHGETFSLFPVYCPSPLPVRLLVAAARKRAENTRRGLGAGSVGMLVKLALGVRWALVSRRRISQSFSKLA